MLVAAGCISLFLILYVTLGPGRGEGFPGSLIGKWRGF